MNKDPNAEVMEELYAMVVEELRCGRELPDPEYVHHVYATVLEAARATL